MSQHCFCKPKFICFGRIKVIDAIGMNKANLHNYARVVQLLHGFQEFLEQQRSEFDAIGVTSWDRFRRLFFSQSKILMGLYAEMIVASKLEEEGHDVYSVSLKGKADAGYWNEAYLPEAKNKGDADLYVKDLQRWVEVKISKSYTSPEGKTYDTKRPFFLWTWNHLSIREAAKNGKFDFLVLVGLNSLSNYLGKPEDLFYWIFNREEASLIESEGDIEWEKKWWFFLIDEPDIVIDKSQMPWWVPIGPKAPFFEKQFRQCKEWSRSHNIRVTYKEKWTKIQ